MARLLMTLALLGFGAATSAQAAALADPTRPPAALFAPASPASAPHAAARPAPAPQSLHVLSVRLPAQGAPSALIDDRLVGVGDKVGGRTVAAIDAAGVQLRDAQGHLSRLALIDDVVVVRRPAQAEASLLPLPALTDPTVGDAPAPVATLAGDNQR